MSPIVGPLIAVIVIAFCMVLAPDKKPKPKSAKDDLASAIEKLIKESKN